MCDIKLRASEKTVAISFLYLNARSNLPLIDSQQTPKTQRHSVRIEKGGNILRQDLSPHPGSSSYSRVKEKLANPHQAVLGGISLNSTEYKSGDSQPQLEAISVFRHVSRIARSMFKRFHYHVANQPESAVVEVAVVKKLGAQIKYGLEL